MMRPWHLLSVAFALLLAVACVEETVPPDQEVASGTGSSGGNPSLIDFQLATEAAPPATTWTRVSIDARTVTYGRRDAEGQCVRQPGRYTYESFVRYNAGQGSGTFDTEGICRIRLSPAEGVPLIRVEGSRQGRMFAVQFMLPRGLGFVFDSDLPATAPGEFLSLVSRVDVGVLLRGIDLDLLSEAREVLSDEDEDVGLTLLENLGDAVLIYLDPSPGDGMVTAEERTEENVIGTVRPR